MFSVDPELFFKAQDALSTAFDEIQTLKKDLTDCISSCPINYEYKSELNNINDTIIKTSRELSSLTRTVSETKEKLMGIDPSFSVAFFEAASNKFEGYMLPLNEEQLNYVNYAKAEAAEAYNELIIKQLTDLKNQGLLSDEDIAYLDQMIAMRDYEKEYQSNLNELERCEELLKGNLDNTKREEIEAKINELQVSIQSYEIGKSMAGADVATIDAKIKELEQELKGLYNGNFIEHLAKEAEKQRQLITIQLNILTRMKNDTKNDEFRQKYQAMLADPDFMKKVNEGKEISKHWDASGMRYDDTIGYSDTPQILGMVGDSWAYDRYMSEEEINMYYYVLATNNTKDEYGRYRGIEAGKEYLNHFKQNVNDAYGKELGENLKKAYNEGNEIVKAFMIWSSSTQQGFSGFFQSIGAAADKALGYDVDTTISGDDIGANAFRENILYDENGNYRGNGAKVAQLLYDGNKVTTNMIIPMTLGMGPGGQVLSSVTIWGQSYGSNYEEKIREGYSDYLASSFASKAATAEMVLEKAFSVVPGIKAFKGPSPKSYKSLLANTIKDKLLDTGTEVLQDKANLYFANEVLLENNDLSIFEKDENGNLKIKQEDLDTFVVSLISSSGMSLISDISNVSNIKDTHASIAKHASSVIGAELSYNQVINMARNGNSQPLLNGLSITHDSFKVDMLESIDSKTLNAVVDKVVESDVDGLVSVFGYNNMDGIISKLNNVNINKVMSNLNSDGVNFLENNLSLISQNKIESAKNNVGETKLFTAKDFALLLPDIGINILNLAGRKSLGSTLTAEQNQDVLNKIKEEGIVHITSEESSGLILDSNYVKKTKAGIQSYGSAKSFFFAGTPTIEGVAFNLDKLKPVMTGVRIRPTDAQISDLKVRLSDGSIFNKGDFNFETGQAEQVYYGLTFEDGNLVYKEITAEKAQNYQPDVTPEQSKIIQNKFALGLKTFISGMQADRVKLLKDIQKIKGQPIYNEVVEQLGTVDLNLENVMVSESIETLDVNSQINKSDSNVIIDGLSCHLAMPDLLVESLNAKGFSDVFSIENGVYTLKEVDSNTRFEVLNAITNFISSDVGQLVLDNEAALDKWSTGVGKTLNTRGNAAEFMFNQGKVEQACSMLTKVINDINVFRQELFNDSIELTEQIETLDVEEQLEMPKLAKNVIDSDDSVEIINTKDLDTDTVSIFGDRTFDVNKTYEGYDYVIRAEGNIVQALDKIDFGMFNTYLLEVSSLSDINSELLSNLPNNIDVRIIGGYTVDYMNTLKSPNGTQTRQQATYTIKELQEIMDKVSKFEEGIDKNWNDYEKALYTYNYLKDNIKYVANPGSTNVRPKQFDSLMSLVAEESTCIGFAYTYKELLNRIGIQCDVVSGSLNGIGQHGYNVVTIDGKSFLVDTVKESLSNTDGSTGFGVENYQHYIPKSENAYIQGKINTTNSYISIFLGNSYVDNSSIEILEIDDFNLSELEIVLLNENVEYINKYFVDNLDKILVSENLYKMSSSVLSNVFDVCYRNGVHPLNFLNELNENSVSSKYSDFCKIIIEKLNETDKTAFIVRMKGDILRAKFALKYLSRYENKIDVISNINSYFLESIKNSSENDLELTVKNAIVQYENFINNLSNKSVISIKDSIIKLKQDLNEKNIFDDLSLARAIYLRLGNELSYSKLSPSDVALKQANLINANSLENVNRNVVCYSWSALFKESLVSAGIDKNNVRIIKHADNAHHYVCFKADNKYFVADATFGYENHSVPDLLSIKLGKNTHGFFEISAKHGEALFSNSINPNLAYKYLYFNSINSDFKNIDNALGRNFNGNVLDLQERLMNSLGTMMNVFDDKDILDVYLNVLNSSDLNATEIYEIFHCINSEENNILLSTYSSKFDSNFYFSLLSYKNINGEIFYYLKPDYGNFEKVENIEDVFNYLNINNIPVKGSRY